MTNTTYKSLSQKATKQSLSTPDTFRGGVWITRNGDAELFVQTAEERQQELTALEQQRQAYALLRLALLAKQDVAEGRVSSALEVRAKMHAARNGEK